MKEIKTGKENIANEVNIGQTDIHRWGWGVKRKTLALLAASFILFAFSFTFSSCSSCKACDKRGTKPADETATFQESNSKTISGDDSNTPDGSNPTQDPVAPDNTNPTSQGGEDVPTPIPAPALTKEDPIVVLVAKLKKDLEEAAVAAVAANVENVAKKVGGKPSLVALMDGEFKNIAKAVTAADATERAMEGLNVSNDGVADELEQAWMAIAEAAVFEDGLGHKERAIAYRWATKWAMKTKKIDQAKLHEREASHQAWMAERVATIPLAFGLDKEETKEWARVATEVADEAKKEAGL
jgi:hypothetical protein